MKTIKFFLVYSFFFLLNPTLTYAAPTGQKSFIASLPIVPLVILFLLLIVSGAIVYLQLKKEKQTPYGLPVSRPPEPPTETPPLTQSVNPPVQGYTEQPSQPEVAAPLEANPPPPPRPLPTELPTPPVAPPIPPVTKPIFPKAVLIGGVFVLLTASVAGGAFFLIKKIKKPRILVVNQYQCTSGCDGRVCDQEAAARHYNWCSKDKRCNCTGVGQAAPMGDQYWCEGQCTMYCGETSANSCGSKVDSSNRKNCGNCGAGNGCDHYDDCVGMECGWPASSYCHSGQCGCADIGQQREEAAKHPGWLLCQDTAPRCTPPACPSGWVDCGLGHARTDNSPECVQKEKCGPIACSGCGNTYIVWRFCKPGGGTTPQITPTPTSTPTQTPTPTPTFGCNNLTIDKQTAVVGDTVNLTASVTNFGLLHYGKCPGTINCRVSETTNLTLTQGNNTFTANVLLTLPGIYVFELNAYESNQCRFLCSPGRILYQNTLHVGPGTPTPTFPAGTPTPVFPGCDSAGHWQQIATQCNSGTNCIKWLTVGGRLTPTVTPTVTPPPVCRGLRLLLNRGGTTWSDMTASERNTVQPGTVVRVALPKIVGTFTAEKAEFHVYIDGATELQRDSTDEMDIGGIRYFYTEFTARYGASPPTTFSSYSIDGWLYFNGIWY